MPIFLVLAGLMVAVALAFLVVPLLRRARADAPHDGQARRLRALDQALAAGVIDADEYAQKQRSLIGDVAEPVGVAAAPSKPSRATFVALIAVAVLLPASALLIYRVVGAPEALDPANLAQQAPARGGDSGPEMQQAIATLVQRLKDHPEDVEGWALLGRAYQALNRPNDSLDAFKHAHALAADNTALTVEYAQALAMVAPTRRIEGESRSLLEGVLKTEPQNQRALWLLGISAYQDAHYDEAIARWNTLIPLLPADSEVVQSVRKQIADAEAKRDGKPLPEPVAPAVASTPPTTPAPAANATVDTGAPRLTIEVSLDPKLVAQSDPEATLFVFARADKGPPMPLAIQRLKARQLPLTVTLDDSSSMMPTMKLSTFPKVIVGARISRSGNAMPQSGDLQVLSAPVDSHRKEPLALMIDQQVP